MSNISKDEVFEYMGHDQRAPYTHHAAPYNVVSVRFHPSITKISACSFRNYTKLREVALNDCIVQIGKEAFSGCSSLESFTLPSTMIKIYSYAFFNCSRLQNVIFNKGLREIEAFAFYGCTSLESITIPSTVTEIGNYAFHDCSSLREVELQKDGLQIQNMGKDIFVGCSMLENLPFPRISTRLRNIIPTDQVEVKSKIDELLLLGGIDLMLEGGRDDQRVTLPCPIARESSILTEWEL